MRPLLLLTGIYSLLSLTAGCADTNTCPPGRFLKDGTCKFQPELRSREELLATFCRLAPDLRVEAEEQPTLLFGEWTLRVEPLEQLVAGESFAVRLGGSVVWPADFMSAAAATVPGGLQRVAVREVNATVSVRRGASPVGPPPVLKVASVTPAPIELCTYDEEGQTGPEAGPFPACSRDGDNADGSNDGCTGLGGGPSSSNPCLPFIVFSSSQDCSEGGVCESVAGSLGLDSSCGVLGYCLLDDMQVEFEETLVTYIADEEEDVVLFGWADDVGQEIRDGPNKGVIQLDPPRLAEPAGPNGIRLQVEGLPLGAECSMGVDSRGPYGVGSAAPAHSRTPDALLIALPIASR